LGYIPETVWNESGNSGGAWLWASGGGVSQVYKQPAWQNGVNGAAAANGMRAVPDVSLSAASHDGYIISENGSNWIVSGTSAAAPSFAAMMALVVEASGGMGQGNANTSLYPLAASASSPFHATTQGNNSVPGVAGFTAGGQTYNLATGLGSVDAALLVSSFASAATPPPTLSFAAVPSPIVILQGSAGSVQLTAATGGSFTGDVTLSVAGLPAGVSVVWSNNPIVPQAGTGSATLTLSASPLAQAASASVVITAQGSGLTATRQVTLQVEQRRLPVRGRPAPIRPPRMVPRAW
jgi:subtilase family serine protease